jgi:hypothetical protein
MTTATLTTLRLFWGSFMRTDLYDAGYSDAVQWCGATSAETEEDMRRALSYLKGFADACRIACPYMSPSWQIANLVGIAAATFQVADGQFERLAAQYKREIADLLGKL